VDPIPPGLNGWERGRTIRPNLPKRNDGRVRIHKARGIRVLACFHRAGPAMLWFYP